MKRTDWSIVALTLFALATAPSQALSAGAAASSFAGTSLRVSDASIAVSCPLTVGGGFEAKTNALQGELKLDPARTGSVVGELSVDLRTLQTGISLRDSHMREKYLEVQRGDGFSAASLESIRLGSIDHVNPGGKTTFKGVLTLHGKAREVEGTAEIRRTEQGLRVQASFPVKVSDFEIASPAYLGIGVRNEVGIVVNFKLGPAA